MLPLKYSSQWEDFLLSMKKNFSFFGLNDWALLGGAVRDYFSYPKHKTTIKDLDIFYYGELPEALIDAYVTKAINNGPYPDDGPFTCTHKGKYQSWSVDFIQIKPGNTYFDVLKAFPCNASQIGARVFNGHVDIFHTQVFEEFYVNNVLLFYNTCPDEYKHKILQKFPNLSYGIHFPDQPSLFTTIPNQWTIHFPTDTTAGVKKSSSLKKYKVINSEKELYREFGW